MFKCDVMSSQMNALEEWHQGIYEEIFGYICRNLWIGMSNTVYDNQCTMLQDESVRSEAEF